MNRLNSLVWCTGLDSVTSFNNRFILYCHSFPSFLWENIFLFSTEWWVVYADIWCTGVPVTQGLRRWWRS